MTTTFLNLSPEDIRQKHPSYCREDIICFLILKDGIPTGLYGLIDRGIDLLTKARQAEAFLTIFPEFRFRVLGKAFFLALFDHAFSTGFQKIYTWTRLLSWQKLLRRFESIGIHRLQSSPQWDPDPSDKDPSKIWFVKVKG